MFLSLRVNISDVFCLYTSHMLSLHIRRVLFSFLFLSLSAPLYITCLASTPMYASDMFLHFYIWDTFMSLRRYNHACFVYCLYTSNVCVDFSAPETRFSTLRFYSSDSVFGQILSEEPRSCHKLFLCWCHAWLILCFLPPIFFWNPPPTSLNTSWRTYRGAPQRLSKRRRCIYLLFLNFSHFDLFKVHACPFRWIILEWMGHCPRK